MDKYAPATENILVGHSLGRIYASLRPINYFADYFNDRAPWEPGGKSIGINFCHVRLAVHVFIRKAGLRN